MNFLIYAVIALFLIAAALIARIFLLTQNLSVKKYEMVDKKANNFNGILMILFLVFGFIGLYLVTKAYTIRDVYAFESASEHGPLIDGLFNVTLLTIGIVFILTNILLFYFAYKYRYKEGAKAYYFTHSNKLEIIWTIIPAIVMCYLVIEGGIVWNKVMMTDPPENAYLIEVTAKQFAWKIRYPGKDGKLGKTIHKLRTPENELGLDPNDPAAQDDIIVGGASGYYIPVNQPVLLKINALDVLHSVFLPHFRVKMDAVPGVPTQFCFTPNVTTEEMRKKVSNDDFNFEMACAELCGKSHFAMKGVVIVDDIAKVNEWLNAKKPFFESLKDNQVASL